jgi:hypothetical protein
MTDAESTPDPQQLAITTQPEVDPRHARETMQLLKRAVRNRWPIPDQMREVAPKIAARIAVEGKTDRERLRAIELLASLDRDNIAALATLDKIERLDGGEATERIELLPIRIGVRQ